jgi:hypothetical protein
VDNIYASSLIAAFNGIRQHGNDLAELEGISFGELAVSGDSRGIKMDMRRVDPDRAEACNGTYNTGAADSICDFLTRATDTISHFLACTTNTVRNLFPGSANAFCYALTASTNTIRDFCARAACACILNCSRQAAG